MKFCPNCGTQLDDAATFCANCGTTLGAMPTAGDPADHTAEFTPEDISENKIFAMLPYLMGVFGVIIASLAAKDSAYVKFHNKQAIKLLVCTILTTIATVVLSWTCIVPFAGLIALCIIEVLSIIAFFQVCGGKAKEPAIIRNISFLK